MPDLFDPIAARERKFWRLVQAGAEHALRPFLPAVEIQWVPWGSTGPYDAFLIRFAGMTLKVPFDAPMLDPLDVARVIYDETRKAWVAYAIPPLGDNIILGGE